MASDDIFDDYWVTDEAAFRELFFDTHLSLREMVQRAIQNRVLISKSESPDA